MRDIPRTAARRGRRLACVVAAGALVLSGCGGGGSQVSRTGNTPAAPAGGKPAALRKVTIGVPSIEGTTTYLQVGKALGLFAAHGLNAQIVAMKPNVELAALSKGQVDFIAAVASATEAAERGQAVRLVTITANRPPYLLIGLKGISSLQQLRGKVVGLSNPQTAESIVGQALLQKAGLGPGSYRPLYIGSSDIAKADMLLAGKVAASIVNAFSAAPVLDKGYPVLANGATTENVLTTGLATSTAEIRAHPNLIRRTVAAVDAIAAVFASSSNESKVVPLLMRFQKLNQTDAQRLFEQVRGIWNAGGRPSQAALDFQFNLDAKLLHLAKRPPESAVADLQFLGQG